MEQDFFLGYVGYINQDGEDIMDNVALIKVSYPASSWILVNVCSFNSISNLRHTVTTSFFSTQMRFLPETRIPWQICYPSRTIPGTYSSSQNIVNWIIPIKPSISVGISRNQQQPQSNSSSVATTIGPRIAVLIKQ